MLAGGCSLRILLVEDDVFFMNILMTLLASSPGPVDAVYDAEKAIEMLRSERYDLMITDLVMDGMNGVDLIHQALAERLLDSNRIFVVTGQAEASPLVRAVRELGIQLLPKPFTRQEFSDAIRALSLDTPSNS